MSRVVVKGEQVDVTWQQLKEIDELAASLTKAAGEGAPAVTREQAAEQYLANLAKPVKANKKAAPVATEEVA